MRMKELIEELRKSQHYEFIELEGGKLILSGRYTSMGAKNQLYLLEDHVPLDEMEELVERVDWNGDHWKYELKRPKVGWYVLLYKVVSNSGKHNGCSLVVADELGFTILKGKGECICELLEQLGIEPKEVV